MARYQSLAACAPFEAARATANISSREVKLDHQRRVSWSQSARMKYVNGKGIENTTGSTSRATVPYPYRRHARRIRTDIQTRCAKGPHLRRDVRETEPPSRPEYIDVATCAHQFNRSNYQSARSQGTKEISCKESNTCCCLDGLSLGKGRCLTSVPLLVGRRLIFESLSCMLDHVFRGRVMEYIPASHWHSAPSIRC